MNAVKFSGTTFMDLSSLGKREAREVAKQITDKAWEYHLEYTSLPAEEGDSISGVSRNPQTGEFERFTQKPAFISATASTENDAVFKQLAEDKGLPYLQLKESLDGMALHVLVSQTRDNQGLVKKMLTFFEGLNLPRLGGSSSRTSSR